MIKILFFIETLSGGGAEKVLCDLVNHMDQTKYDITVETLWPSENRKKLVNGIKYKSVYPSHSRFNNHKMRLESALGLIYSLHMKDDYDIEAAYLEMGTTKILASSTNKKAKKLAWVHCDLSMAVADPKAFAAKTASWYEKYDKVVCVSQNVKESFDRLFQNRFDSTVLYNVINDAEVIEKAKLPLPEGVKMQGLTVLSIGRLTRPKNYIRLLKAHKRLLDDGISHKLWILGEGPDRQMLEQYVSDNNLNDSVWMPGFIDNPYPFMKEADLLVCSSIFEGYSTFVTEGVILRKPIVTTDVSGMRELLGDSEYGMIVKNDDEDFYQGMKRMLTERDLRDKYAKAASLRSKDFSAIALTNAAERFFEELI